MMDSSSSIMAEAAPDAPKSSRVSRLFNRGKKGAHPWESDAAENAAKKEAAKKQQKNKANAASTTTATTKKSLGPAPAANRVRRSSSGEPSSTNHDHDSNNSNGDSHKKSAVVFQRSRTSPESASQYSATHMNNSNNSNNNKNEEKGSSRKSLPSWGWKSPKLFTSSGKTKRSEMNMEGLLDVSMSSSDNSNEQRQDTTGSELDGDKPNQQQQQSQESKPQESQSPSQQQQQQPRQFEARPARPGLGDKQDEINMSISDIDFVRDEAALREAIAEEVLAMWDAQGLYADLPELRQEILKGVVEQKFVALQKEQQDWMEQKQTRRAGQGSDLLHSLSMGENTPIQTILEEEEDEDEEEEVSLEAEEEDDKENLLHPEEPEPSLNFHDSKDIALPALMPSALDDSSPNAPANHTIVSNNNSSEDDEKDDNGMEPTTMGAKEEEDDAVITVDIVNIEPPNDETIHNAWNLLLELQDRLQTVDQSEFATLEAEGRLGMMEPSQVPIRDPNAFEKFKLKEAIHHRVSRIYTDDHHIVSNDKKEREDEDAPTPIDEEADSSENENQAGSSGPVKEKEDHQTGQEEVKRSPTKIDKATRRSLSQSFAAFDAMLSRNRRALEKQYSIAEFTIQDDDEWTVETIKTKEANSPVKEKLQFRRTQSKDLEKQPVTRQMSNNMRAARNAARRGGGKRGSMDRTIRRCNSKDRKKTFTLSAASSAASSDEDDTMYEEYTVDMTMAESQSVTPPRRGATVVDVDAVRAQPDEKQRESLKKAQEEMMQSFESLKQSTDDEDDSYLEYTIQDDILPSKYRLNRNHPKDLAMPEPPPMDNDISNRANASIKSDDRADALESALSSSQQQKSHRLSMDTFGNVFPTITTTELDDDELTQLTFDHTMDGGVSVTPDHMHAAAYLRKSEKKDMANNLNYSNHNSVSTSNRGQSQRDSVSAKNKSSPRSNATTNSQRTEKTRDTTIPNDEVSPASVSSANEKSQQSGTALSKSVAKILRVDIWSPKASKVQAAMEKLVIAAAHSASQRSNITRLGGVIAILRAMQIHTDKSDIQISACEALEHLATESETQVAIEDVGGIAAIVVAMKQHVEDAKVQLAACRALVNITSLRSPSNENHNNSSRSLSRALSSDDEEEETENTDEHGAVPALVAAMTRYPSDAEIQAKAFCALANLCLDNRERLQELSDSGGLMAMTMALQKKWSNKMEQHEAISTLSILLRSLAELDSSNTSHH